GRAAGRLPRGLLLRDLPLDRLDGLGARDPSLPVRPQLGRAALGARSAPLADGLCNHPGVSRRLLAALFVLGVVCALPARAHASLAAGIAEIRDASGNLVA